MDNRHPQSQTTGVVDTPGENTKAPPEMAEEIAREIARDQGALPTVDELQERVAARRSVLIRVLRKLREEAARQEAQMAAASQMPDHIRAAGVALAQTMWAETSRIHVTALGEMEGRMLAEQAHHKAERDDLCRALDDVEAQAEGLRQKYRTSLMQLADEREARLRAEAEANTLRALIASHLGKRSGDFGDVACGGGAEIPVAAE